jgi:predicted TIM-barrel fold metal-dependent hydrolase
MLKIHPPTQGVDVSDRRHAPFFRRCAALDVLVLVHTGHEHSAPVIDIALADPLRLELALKAALGLEDSQWRAARLLEP